MFKEQLEISYLSGANSYYLEELYEEYLSNPNSIDQYWRDFFDIVSLLPGNSIKDQSRLSVEKSIINLLKTKRISNISNQAVNIEYSQKHTDVLRLIAAYRIVGSRKANLDPLNRFGESYIDSLDPAHRNLLASDMATNFIINSKFAPNNELTLAEIIEKLEQTYCRHIGSEYMYITSTEERIWVRNKLEETLATPNFNKEEKINILKNLTAAETLERYLHTKYVGQKRFSLEGGESLIPALNHLINIASKKNVNQVVIGMAHRGRLNVLVNILGKSPKDLFAEFEGNQTIELTSGDVKYHNGYSSDVVTDDGHVHIALEFNPSHLEIVNPVVEGHVRAKQTLEKGPQRINEILPVLIHGDAAFMGLGVNQAVLNLSQTRGYTTGGTVHIVVNNQIGFTTSDLRDMRSSTYCTDIAKMIDAPVFHVNSDDPEAVCYVINLALEYRMKFNKDALVDIVCYRKLGHNESDDPFMTQPMMYKKILKHPGTRKLYADKLIKENIIAENDGENFINKYKIALEKGEQVKKTYLGDHNNTIKNKWISYKETPWDMDVDTSLVKEDIKNLTDLMTTVPDNFNIHRTISKIINQRRLMGEGKANIDWGMSESLAYASLLSKGINVRITGEDSGRGTFSHRHAILHDQNRERWDQGIYIPLNNLSQNQGQFMIFDSILNEEAVLAYEYGYSSSAPEDLVIWEAQFGDFANGAQVAIDQFITSGEAKWGRLSGLTVILPHGYDGQGPEHSSGRLERWMQLCAHNNIQIVMMSEAAQFFHVLRRQIIRPYRKPLIIFLSKKLLRFKDSFNDINSFIGDEKFKNIIVEKDKTNASRLIFCSGQVYYDLVKERANKKLDDNIAIIRIEQLYPFPYNDLKNALNKFKKVKKYIWCQEEPKNQGAWFQVRDRINKSFDKKIELIYAGRSPNAAPAAGYKKLHDEQLVQLVNDALINN